MTYNGWTNHATWNAFNWISGDYAAQKHLEGLVEDGATVSDLAEAAVYVHGLIERTDLDPGEVETINWTEIAEAYME